MDQPPERSPKDLNWGLKVIFGDQFFQDFFATFSYRPFLDVRSFRVSFFSIAAFYLIFCPVFDTLVERFPPTFMPVFLLLHKYL